MPAPLTASELAHLCRAAATSVDGPARAALMELGDRAQALADDAMMRTPVAELSDVTDRALFGFSVSIDGQRVDPREMAYDRERGVYTLPGGIELELREAK